MPDNKTKRKKTPPVVTTSIDGKVPPQALDIERAVIGALLIDSNAYADVCEILKSDSFYDPKHARIYQAIVDLSVNQQAIDLFTVSQQLKKNSTLDEAGGEVYLAQLSSEITSAAHIEYHARIIAQKHLARELIRLSLNIQRDAYDDTTDVDELILETEQSIYDISQNNIKKDFVKVSEIIPEAIKRINIAAEKKEGISGLASGFGDVDKVTAGWQPSDLIIIAARPAMGKTAFVLSMAKNIAIDNNEPVGLFSLEMSNVQLLNRLLCNVCEIESNKIKTGRLNNNEWEKLNDKIKIINNAPLYLDDTPGLSVLELQTKARRLVHDHGVKIIIIDYLQLMNANGMKSFGSREQEVSMISRSLKGLAKELDIPIIALSQLSRSVEKRDMGNGAEGRRPQLSDLRESGAIEQDADIVCFIHRPEYYRIYEDENGDTRGKAYLIIAKHRNGAVKDVPLAFRGEFTQFLTFGAGVTINHGPITIESKMNNSPADDNGNSQSDVANADFSSFIANNSDSSTPF